MKLLNRSSVTLLAKAPFAEWVMQLPLDDEQMEAPVSADVLCQEGNVYLISEVDSEADFQQALQRHWRQMLENELSAWDEFGDHWPDLSYELLCDWFEIKHQIMTFDLAEDTLLVASLEDLGE